MDRIPPTYLGMSVPELFPYLTERRSYFSYPISVHVDVSDLNYYRLITLTSVLPKVFETAISN